MEWASADDRLFHVLSLNLKQQTLLQAPGSYSGRIKFLDNHQNLMKSLHRKLPVR